MTTVTSDVAATTVLLNRWQAANQKLATLAEVFDSEQLERELVAGTRTPAAVLRHVGFWNEYVANRLRGKTVDDTTNEWPADTVRTKRDLLNALARSADDVILALRETRGPSSQQAIEQVTPFLEHVCEHYGQLAVYARLLGVVPPASRA